MKDSTELHTCSLEMKGGLEADIDYPAKYMHAAQSKHPTPSPNLDKPFPPRIEAMRMTMYARK